MENKKLNRYSFYAACVWNGLAFTALVLFLSDYAAGTQEQEIISFMLEGTHAEKTVSQTAEALGWNVTVFEPLNNGTIVVNATRLS